LGYWQCAGNFFYHRALATLLKAVGVNVWRIRQLFSSLRDAYKQKRHFELSRPKKCDLYL
jgi:hypothetical protein